MKAWLWFCLGMAAMWVLSNPGMFKTWVLTAFALLGVG